VSRLLDKPEARLCAVGGSALLMFWPVVADFGWDPGTKVAVAFATWSLAIVVLFVDSVHQRRPTRQP
jgi:hypothetical protein